MLLILAILVAPQLAVAEGVICTQEVWCGSDGVLFEFFQDKKADGFCSAQKLLHCAELRAENKSLDSQSCDSQVSELSTEMQKMQKRNKRLRNRIRRLKAK